MVLVWVCGVEQVGSREVYYLNMHKCSTQKFVKHVGISLLMCLAALHCSPLHN